MVNFIHTQNRDDALTASRINTDGIYFTPDSNSIIHNGAEYGVTTPATHSKDGLMSASDKIFVDTLGDRLLTIDNKNNEQDTLIQSNRQEINAKQFDISAAVFDALPIQNSENLVRSGGIYTAINQLKNRIVFLTEEQYNALVEAHTVDANCIYMIYEDDEL